MILHHIHKTAACIPLKANKYLPILNRCTWIFAATDTNHDGREQKKEAGHGKTHAVHRFVAHDDITVNLVFHTKYSSSSLAKSWDLQNMERKKKPIIIKTMQE